MLRPRVAADVVLSRREREILDQLGRGFRDKEIAAQLGISIETVRTHVRNAQRTLGAHTRAHAVALLSHRERTGRIRRTAATDHRPGLSV